MLQDCKFNPQRDQEKTVPGLALDLSAAIENGVVLDTGVNTEFNDIDDPRNIRSRIKNAFDAADARKVLILGASKAQTKVENKSTVPAAD